MDDALTTYLADHTAGAASHVLLIDRELERAPEASLAAFLTEARDQIRRDQEVLRGILEKRGDAEAPGRTAADWIAEKLRRLTAADDATSLGRLQVLELVVLGIHARMLLWTALESVAQIQLELQALDFGWLRKEAEALHQRADRFRIEAARTAFVSSLEREAPRAGA
jgi:hypothetical protein